MSPSPHPPEPPARHPSGWDALVSTIEDQEPAGRPPPGSGGRSWSRHAGRFALLVLAAAAVFGVQRLNQPQEPTPLELDRGRRALLSLISSSLEDHLRIHGEYPQALDEVLPVRLEAAYRRTPAGYELSVQLSDGQRLTTHKP